MAMRGVAPSVTKRKLFRVHPHSPHNHQPTRGFRNIILGTRGTRLESAGDPAASEACSKALYLQWRHGFPSVPRGFGGRATQGFLSYPAMMQPAAARTLIEFLTQPGEVVCDVFAGSGTVLVEALRTRRQAIGADLSPLAVSITRTHTWRPGLSVLNELHDGVVQRVVRRAEVMVPGGSGSPMELSSWQALHEAVVADQREVLGFGGWEGEDSSLDPADLRDEDAFGEHDVLRLLAYAAMKAGAKRSSLRKLYHDALKRRGVGADRFSVSENELSKAEPLDAASDARGEVSFGDIFSSVCRDYVKRASQLELEAGKRLPPARVMRCDARLFSLPEAWPRAKAIVTSPPYPGVLDYLSHARKERSLIDPAGLRNLSVVDGRTVWPEAWCSTDELAPRKAMRKTRSLEEFRDRWIDDQRAWLERARNALVPGGVVAIMVGDGDAAGETLDGLKGTIDAVGLVDGLELLASASAMSSLESVGLRQEHIIMARRVD